MKVDKCSWVIQVALRKFLASHKAVSVACRCLFIFPRNLPLSSKNRSTALLQLGYVRLGEILLLLWKLLNRGCDHLIIIIIIIIMNFSSEALSSNWRTGLKEPNLLSRLQNEAV